MMNTLDVKQCHVSQNAKIAVIQRISEEGVNCTLSRMRTFRARPLHHKNDTRISRALKARAEKI